MTKRVAVIAAHPDDEVLGCGGAIARHVEQGDEVHVLIMAEGLTSRLPVRDREQLQGDLTSLQKQARNAHEVLGTTSLEMLDFPDNRMDSLDFLDVVKSVESYLGKVRPEIIYTHFPHDLNVDHRIVSEAVQTACRPLPNSMVKQILFFEIASSTEWRLAAAQSFVPNYFVSVELVLDKKLRALAVYASEMRPFPHARSIEGIEALAKWRGVMVGVDAAEGFVVGRILF